jgi:hypothetical protein
VVTVRSRSSIRRFHECEQVFERSSAAAAVAGLYMCPHTSK